MFGLYDAFKQAQVSFAYRGKMWVDGTSLLCEYVQELKRYLSTEALKSTLSKSDLAANSALEEAKVALEESVSW